jgi:predicted nuclease of restriction endonuclease-like (RecB) superfamily
MIQFAEKYPDKEIVAALTRQLGWSHFRELITIKEKLKRDFYAEMCRVERWSYRALEKKIGSMLFERTALSRKPKELAQKELKALKDDDVMTTDLVFRDPYFLDFLGLKGSYSEKDLETAILREIENFLVELGSDFAFISRQKRITVGDTDYYIDLLFFHRRLKSLCAIELKLDKFKPEHKGQMELYLRWLERYEMRPGENKPIGLILCATKHHEEIEIMELGKSGIRVSEYLTELPPRDILEKKLHAAIENSKTLLNSKRDK